MDSYPCDCKYSQIKTVESIAQRLEMQKKMVLECLQVLQEMGLVEQVEHQWNIKTWELHLPSDSIHWWNQQQIWKGRALQDIQKQNPDSIHYNAIHTLSVKDFEKLKGMILNFIQGSRTIVAASPEEEIVCVLCDLFRI